MSALWLTHLDGPAPPSDPDQDRQRHRAGHKAAVEGQLPGALIAADQQPALGGMAAAIRLIVVEAEERPVVEAVAFGALAARDLLPCPRRNVPEQGVGTLGRAAEPTRWSQATAST
jgi:hypothetical protein